MYTQDHVENCLKAAIATFTSNDSYLLLNDLNERTLTAKFASYLQTHFTDRNVDCEYNRDLDDPKRIGKWIGKWIKQVPTDDVRGQTVFPDVIVHERGNNKHNLLVIEAKKTTNKLSLNRDKDKLRSFKDSLGYTYAVFMLFDTDGKKACICYEFI